MTIGDKVRATYPFAGVPSCDGIIISEQVLGDNVTHFLVSFEVRPKAYKKFHLTERELTLCSEPESEQPASEQPVLEQPVSEQPEL